MSVASHRPAIIGAAQVVQRIEDPRAALEPVGLMEQAVRRAAEDAGAPELVGSLDAILVPRGLWRYGDPGRMLAERLGSPDAKSGLGGISGHIVQRLVNRACQMIASGECEVVAVVGAESENSRRRLQREGAPLPWDEAVPGHPEVLVGELSDSRTEQEIAAGIVNAVAMFAVCETSLRHSLGETPAAHRDRIARLYERISAVAARNPHAWIQQETPSERIREPGPGNRMVSYPYTKLMTSNISVDQGAALILCSEAAARRFGIADDRRVYLRAATEMNHTTALTQRQVLHHHPGQELAARRVLELAAIEVDDLHHVDLYSCFPFAVQAGASALGLPLEPVPSLTGGMTFFGGPFANYVIHSKATLVERLRAEPGSLGAIGSVGGCFAHFAYGIYSTDPGEHDAPRVEDVSDGFAALPTRPIQDEHQGPATVEAYTVDVRHEGPYQASFALLTDDGARVWGRSHEPSLMQALLDDEDPCGRPARLKDGLVELD